MAASVVRSGRVDAQHDLAVGLEAGVRTAHLAPACRASKPGSGCAKSKICSATIAWPIRASGSGNSAAVRLLGVFLQVSPVSERRVEPSLRRPRLAPRRGEQTSFAMTKGAARRC